MEKFNQSPKPQQRWPRHLALATSQGFSGASILGATASYFENLRQRSLGVSLFSSAGVNRGEPLPQFAAAKLASNASINSSTWSFVELSIMPVRITLP